MEDIDAPRVVPGAADRQLDELRVLGMTPDTLMFQTRNRLRHWTLFASAVGEGMVYPCACSRSEVRVALESVASAPHGGREPVYSGRCRDAAHLPEHALPSLAWRFRMNDAAGADDFIVARSGTALDTEGLPAEAGFVPAYNWACALDDYDGAYKLLVRAWDLSAVLEYQRAIQTWLAERDGATPGFVAVFHTSLVVGSSGARLEKRTPGVTLQEMLAAGWSPETLLTRLEAGFAGDVADFAPGRVFGEPERQVTLDALGLLSP